jgi:hypothetical protein
VRHRPGLEISFRLQNSQIPQMLKIPASSAVGYNSEGLSHYDCLPAYPVLNKKYGLFKRILSGLTRVDRQFCDTGPMKKYTSHMR